jgi:hypothetical protein
MQGSKWLNIFLRLKIELNASHAANSRICVIQPLLGVLPKETKGNKIKESCRRGSAQRRQESGAAPCRQQTYTCGNATGIIAVSHIFNNLLCKYKRYSQCN